MKKEKILSEPVRANDQRPRLLLDGDTIVLLKNMERYIYWKTRYPEARLLDPLPNAFETASTGTAPAPSPEPPA